MPNIKYVQSPGPERGIGEMTDFIVRCLQDDKSVLWLVSGGSNIPYSVEAMNIICGSVETARLDNLTVSLTDERYGKPGHKDSNWQQLLTAGFPTDTVQTIPVLTGQAMSMTEKDFGERLRTALNTSDVVVAQFGIGADGHIAGILPYSDAVRSRSTVCAYESVPYRRITVTFNTVRKINQAFVFVFGKSKEPAVKRLRNGPVSLDEQPCHILTEVSNVSLFSDCL